MQAFLQNEKTRKILNIIIFILPIFGIVFIFRDILFQGKIFSHLDVLINFVPYYEFLAHGSSFISQNILSGFPIYVSTNSGWFNPLNKFLFHFLNPTNTFIFLNLTYLFLAYLFSYLYIRRIRLEFLQAILGATIFIFAGQVMLWSETIIITNYYFLMPLSLLILEIALNSKLLKSFFLFVFLGFCFGWGWISGHVQFLIYIYTLAAVYFAFLLWIKYQAEGWKKENYFYFTFFLMTVAISFFIGLPEIKAILDFLPLTARASGVTLDAATAYAYVPHHLVYYLLPYFKIPYLSVSQSFQNYIGILSLLTFFFCFFVRKELKENKYFVFYFWVFIFCFGASIKYSPIAYILHQLPFYNSFRETFRIMFIGDFALGILIAMGASQLWHSREAIYPQMSRWLNWLRRIFLYITLPLVLVVSLVKIFLFEKIENFIKDYFFVNLYKNTVGGFPADHYYRIINSYLHQSIDQFYILSLGMLSLILFSFATYWFFRKMDTYSYDFYLKVFIVITVVNFCLIYTFRIQGIPKNELQNAPLTAQFIEEREKGKEPYRIFSPLMSTTIYNESNRCSFKDLGNWDISEEEFLLRKELIEPNLTLIYNLQSADGYEPYVSVRNSEILGYIGSRFSTTDNHSLDGEKISFEKKIQKLTERKNILRALNIKYVLTLFSIKDKDFKLVLETEVNNCKSKVYVYELNNTFPRYFLRESIVTISPEETFLAKMEKMSTFTEPTILIESNEDVKTNRKKYFEVINPVSYSDIREFRVDLKDEAYLFIGEAQLPHWEATVDGVIEPLLKADYIYSAIHLTAGKHLVKLEYKR